MVAGSTDASRPAWPTSHWRAKEWPTRRAPPQDRAPRDRSITAVRPSHGDRAAGESSRSHWRELQADAGGGTHLPVQSKLLELLGCEGSGKIQRFAESIAGFALALELSTGSAVAGGQFAMAHEKHGRNRPVNWLKQAELEVEKNTLLRAENPNPAMNNDIAIAAK